MTGVSEVVRNARHSWSRLRSRLPKTAVRFIEGAVVSHRADRKCWHNNDDAGFLNGRTVDGGDDEYNADDDEPRLPPPFVVDFRETVHHRESSETEGVDGFPSGDDAPPPADGVPRAGNAPDNPSSFTATGSRWGILLPICSYGAGSEPECWERLGEFLSSLKETTHEADRDLMTAYVAIDAEDEVYDTPEGKQRIRDMVALELGIATKLYVMSAGWRHNICWLWDFLGAKAVEHGEEFFVLLGDDVRLRSPGWKNEIEQEFLDIAASHGLPFGVGVVAFRDEAFPVFPTFPVLHRVHVEVFGRVLPALFSNQEADPYLFQVYRRFGASRFASLARLQNTIGGLGRARYMKNTQVSWKGQLLSDSVHTLEKFLHQPSGTPLQQHIRPLVCLDVVIPSYRCDTAHLCNMLQRLLGEDRRLSSLSVSVVIVVDNPEKFSADRNTWVDFQHKINSWTSNSWVRSWLQERNEGASGARNRGLCQSSGDYVLFLDDDVVPSRTLLDCLAGAIARSPEASILVGQTVLPPPTQMWQHAVYTSNLNFFYRVATELDHPPWGVTANLCIKNPERRGGGVYFDTRYRRRGGGEDIAFCLTLKDVHGFGPDRLSPAVVAVPEAEVEHPFWCNIPAQVAGWAMGDVLCMEYKADRAFYTVPNWAEWMLICGLLGAAISTAYQLPWTPSHALLAALWFPVTASALSLPDAISNLHPEAASARWWFRLSVAVLGVGLTLLQDLVRFLSKLSRGRLNHMLLHFDWMDGQEDHRQCVQLQLFTSTMMSFLAYSIHWAVAQRFKRLTLFLLACLGCLYYIWCISHQDPVIMPSQGDETDRHKRQEPDKSCKKSNAVSALPVAGSVSNANVNSPDGTITNDFPAAPTPFIVLGYQRTGTNLLCGRLFHAKPEVVMHNEMFDARHIWTYYREELWQSDKWKWRSTHVRDSDPDGFMEDVFFLSPQIVQEAPATAVGHKLLPHMWRGSPALHPVFRKALKNHSVKKIILRRENPVELYLSLACAAASGQWIKHNSDGFKVHIPPAVFHKFLQHYEAWYSFYDHALIGQEVCRITFEDLSATSTAADVTMRKALNYLGVDAARPLPDTDIATVKQSQVPVLQKVANLPELQAAFRYTSVAKYLGV